MIAAPFGSIEELLAGRLADSRFPILTRSGPDKLGQDDMSHRISGTINPFLPVNWTKRTVFSEEVGEAFSAMRFVESTAHSY